MAYNNVRNYYRERQRRIVHEWSEYNKEEFQQIVENKERVGAELRKYYEENREFEVEEQQKQILQSEYDRILQSLQEKNLDKREPFEFYRPLYEEEVILKRLPQTGLRLLPIKYHVGRMTTANDDFPETGYKLHPIMKKIITNRYPQYLNIPNTYCRPLGTTDATFNDFNKEQYKSVPIPDYRLDRIMNHVTRILGAQKYMPLHYVDTQFAKLPLASGTGYHNRHSFKIKAHAKYSHPIEYASKPTSKGYFVNAFLEHARTLIHYIKYTGIPYRIQLDTDDPEEYVNKVEEMFETFVQQYPTQLYTRSHISKRTGPLKARPVYAVDDLFLIIETMLTFCLHVQARKMDSAIMYSLETIRGGNVYLDKIAQEYQSYFTIDWSSFDQTVPREITDLFFTRFLPSLLIVSHGYHPTYEYPTHESLTRKNFPQMMQNLIDYLHQWFNHMVFVTADGYAYQRTVAGLPSGLLNTQYMDSFINIFVMIDTMIEYGLSDEDIKDIRFFIMGDDNSSFTHWNLAEVEKFVDFIATYALQRWHMKLSREKSIVTDQRHKIQTLSYQCNFGKPRRDLEKLVAQLCYPEHGVKEKFMSARAVGIAYAACGQDQVFHDFCHDVYNAFIDVAADITPEMRDKYTRFLPGIFKTLDNPTFYLDNFHFPTLMEVQNHVYTWHGELTDDQKWNRAHFINDAFYSPENGITLREHYELLAAEKAAKEQNVNK